MIQTVSAIRQSGGEYLWTEYETERYQLVPNV